MFDLHEFLEPVRLSILHDDRGYNDGQLGRFIDTYDEEFPDLEDTDIVLAGIMDENADNANQVRREFYQLHFWHTDVRIADLGNIKQGATATDSYAAVKTVVSEVLNLNKIVVLLGGSHDHTLGQYYSYKDRNKQIEATVIDAKIDLHSDTPERSENFLMEMLTSEPNVIKHYNHIGFQSYYVHPRMLETMDKLRFDCFRVGLAKEEMEEMEPVIRNSDMISFDISAIKHSDAPANSCSANGFSGEEACMLTRYAGMSPKLSSIGFYGYEAEKDTENLTARQIAQMLWYFVDGKSRSKQEAFMDDRVNFNEFHTVFNEMDTVFLQSKKTGRWWMQLPDKKMIACSYRDYVNASNNEIPERWLRAQERSLGQ